MTRHRSLFIKGSAPYFLLGSSKYIGLFFHVIVGFSYKPSLNSFFVYDFVLAIDCNQLLLIERFSYDLETKTRQQNRNNKRTEIGRFDWFIERIQTRVVFGWLSEHAGVEKLHARELSRNQLILRFDVILQHDWLISILGLSLAGKRRGHVLILSSTG